MYECKICRIRILLVHHNLLLHNFFYRDSKSDYGKLYFKLYSKYGYNFEFKGFILVCVHRMTCEQIQIEDAVQKRMKIMDRNEFYFSNMISLSIKKTYNFMYINDTGQLLEMEESIINFYKVHQPSTSN